jgi:hypothetical protein
MAELADALALGASGRKAVQVQVLFSAPSHLKHSLRTLESIFSIERVFLILLNVVVQNLSENVDILLCKFPDFRKLSVGLQV